MLAKKPTPIKSNWGCVDTEASYRLLSGSRGRLGLHETLESQAARREARPEGRWHIVVAKSEEHLKHSNAFHAHHAFYENLRGREGKGIPVWFPSGRNKEKQQPNPLELSVYPLSSPSIWHHVDAEAAAAAASWPLRSARTPSTVCRSAKILSCPGQPTAASAALTLRASVARCILAWYADCRLPS